MRLVVKRGDTHINEMRFSRGPVYIGRQVGSQVFLPDRAISRQHAVIYTSKDGSWVAEDLDSANKTYLNDTAIHIAPIKSGDKLKVGDFSIDINFETETMDEKPIHLGDTVSHATAVGLISDQQTIIRHLDSDDAQLIRLPARRQREFAFLASHLAMVHSRDKLANELADLVLKQFSAIHIWVAIRSGPTGPMTVHVGKTRAGQLLQFSELITRDAITAATEKQEYTVLPRLTKQSTAQQLRSALIAPISIDGSCLGVIYFANSTDHERYTISDLDYLIFISLHTAGTLKRFVG